ncbi:MAG: HAD-IA family hydrolase [Pseudomonadota bacterium]
MPDHEHLNESTDFEGAPCGAIFDLDGTLVDTADDLAGAMNHVLAHHDVAPLPTQTVRHLVGFGARAMLRAGFDTATGTAPSDAALAQMGVQFVDYYADHLADRSKPYPGVVGLLTALRAAGVNLAVCTNKKESLARPLLQALGLDGFFDRIVGGDTAGCAKPDQAPVLLCLDAMGIDKNEATSRVLFVGDSDTDIRAAQACDLAVAACTYGYGPLTLAAEARALWASMPNDVATFLAPLQR